jgi:hypothetical protein
MPRTPNPSSTPHPFAAMLASIGVGTALLLEVDEVGPPVSSPVGSGRTVVVNVTLGRTQVHVEVGHGSVLVYVTVWPVQVVLGGQLIDSIDVSYINTKK